LSHRWEEDDLPVDIIKGAVAITGVYDADPVFYVSSNEDIRLTPDTAREISAMLHPPLNRTPLVVAVGKAETRGWIGMSRDFFALCQERGIDCSYMEVPGAHHFSVSGQLGERGSLMARTVLTQMGLLSETPS
jgi:arylformamidase